MSNSNIKGGEFIVANEDLSNVYIPEEASEEYKMMEGMMADFFDSEIKNRLSDITEKKDWTVSRDLLVRMGDQGLLGTHMPESLGGMELDIIADTMISMVLGKADSFNVTVTAHTGIGMLPILYFGTEAQKQKYLPDLMAGRKVGAYCLTEPSSGSDALAAKTKAELDESGENYIINGQKMWITNGGFADVFTVFAQVDGDKFTGFIIERDRPGISLGEEEKKLGIDGSSTRQVFFENVKVPVENVLGEIGKGHLIAFNVLNIGRFKLSVLCTGGSKELIDCSIQYAKERTQFKQPISNFGAIKHKIAEQAIRTFATESAIYRAANMISRHSHQLMEEGLDYGTAKLKAAEEYAIECAILKVVGSETLDYTADECVQIHGGMGYSEEGMAARAYRDARINRIFEGTNEINRLLIVDMLLKRAIKGQIDITGPAWEVQKELTRMPSFNQPTEPYGIEIKAIENLKKLSLMVMGAAAKKQLDGELNLEEEQEILMNCADLLIQAYVSESLLFRVMKRDERADSNQQIVNAILKVQLHDTNWQMNKIALDAVASFSTGDLLKTFQMGIKRFTSYPLQNVKELRRVVANHLIEENKFSI